MMVSYPLASIKPGIWASGVGTQVPKLLSNGVPGERPRTCDDEGGGILPCGVLWYVSRYGRYSRSTGAVRRKRR